MPHEPLEMDEIFSPLARDVTSDIVNFIFISIINIIFYISEYHHNFIIYIYIYLI